MKNSVTSRIAGKPARVLSDLGDQLRFYGRTYAWMPTAARKYPKEVVRLLAEVSLGSGALALMGGTVVVVMVLSTAIGIEVGLQASSVFGHIGVDALAGFFSAYFNTRETAPLLTGVALTATVGAGFTAQIGAMRVAEEIDALEVMAVPPIPFLVTTRVIAGMIAVIPLFAVGMITMFFATKLVVTVGYGQAQGTYEHYFTTFLIPGDVLLAFVKVILTAIAIMSISCFYGYRASGGPAGVGRAVGYSVRASLILVVMIDLMFGFAFWGVPSAHIAG